MRPAEEEEDLNALQTAAGPKVRPGFVQQVDALRTKMLGMLNPKTVNGKTMTGPMLGTMISALVASINSGDTMTITDAWEAVIQMQGQRAYETALESSVLHLRWIRRKLFQRHGICRLRRKT